MTRTTYLNIVRDPTHPYMAVIFPHSSGLFRQDIAPCLSMNNNQKWFEKYNKKFKVLSPNSSDLNPIEHLMDLLGKWV